MKRILPLLILLAAASSAVGAVPTLSSISPTSTTTCAGSFSLTLNGTNFANNAKVNFGATQLTPTTSSSTQLVVTVPASSVATAGTVSVTVVNPGGSGGTSNAQTFTINNPPPPVISSAVTATGTVGVAFSYQIVASNCPTSYNATGLPPGLSVNTSTGLISGTPTTAGTYSVTINATNAGGTGSATLTLTIKPAPPVITSSLTTTGTVAAAFSYQITASNSPTSFNATGLPSGLTLNTSTGVISGTPTASGTFTVTISATNSRGTGNATLTITISPPPPPVLTSALTANGTVGVAFTYQIVASNCPTSYNATGLPTGLSVDTSTGAISGTPAVGSDAGSPYSVTISATNSGGTGSATLTITIKPAKPVITSPLTASGQVGVAFSYQITATNNPTSFNATGLPAGL